MAANTTKPLDGIRVLDLTRLLPGPAATQYLADMGADVIKIEDIRSGDYARFGAPGNQRNSALFHLLNRNKRSMRLNLAKAEGRELLHELAKTADVVVESFRPGVAARLGFDYAALQKVNSNIIVASISGYGQTGPYKDRAAHDVNAIAYAGVLDQIGQPDRPSIPNFQIADLAGAAMHTVIGVTTALFERERTRNKGESYSGKAIDISMLDCTLAMNVIPMASMLGMQQWPERERDTLSGGLSCYSVYQTKDERFVALGALEGKFWTGFCEAVSEPEYAKKHAVNGITADGSAPADGVQAMLERVFASKTLYEWDAFAAEHDVCVSPILTLDEALDDPQVRAREMIVTHQDPTDGRQQTLAFPIKMSDFTFEITRPAPQYGQHTAELLAEIGISTEQQENLAAQAVI